MKCVDTFAAIVSARHPGRLRRSVTAAQVEQSWNFLCGRVNSPWITPLNQPAPKPSTVAWEKQPAASTSEIINTNLSSFWTSFNPDLDLPTPDDIFPDDDVGLDELRWRSAPWGQDNWEDTEEDSDDTPTEDEHDGDNDTVSQASNISAASTEDNLMSGIPLKLKILPGKIHLLNPKVHRLPKDSVYSETKVSTATLIRLRSPEGEWYYNTLRNGIHLPRPKDAPPLFRNTKPSQLMDTVVDKWLENGLLVPNPQLKYAQPMCLVPKPDSQVRPIIITLNGPSLS